MLERAVADTGPLVAIIRSREAAHGKCAIALKSLRSPLLTCWPVITEAAWLLRDVPGGIYASLGAQLADAALIYIAEREGIETVLTLDRRDFSVYRTTSGRALTIIPDL